MARNIRMHRIVMKMAQPGVPWSKANLHCWSIRLNAGKHSRQDLSGRQVIQLGVAQLLQDSQSITLGSVSAAVRM